MWKFLLPLFWFMSVGVANAQDAGSGAWIFPGCQAAANDSTADQAKQAVCIGATKTFAYFASSLQPAAGRSCPPGGMTVQQELKVVAQWMEQHPERLHEAFEALLAAAFQEAWPCK
jgi:hypothetical protein